MKPAAIEGADRERFATIEGVGSSVGRLLMHGRNGRAIVQATTAAVGDAAFATVRSVCGRSETDERHQTALRARRGNNQYCGDARQWELNSLGNGTTRVAVPRPRALAARSTRRGPLILAHLPQRVANATD